MAPKKKEQQQKMSLGAFLQDNEFGGSWADEVEEFSGSQPLPPPSVERRTGGYGSGYGGGYGGSSSDRYPARDSYPTQLPTKPPYTAHLGNLSYEVTADAVTDFFADCEISNVRIIEDRLEQRPKGFAYAEFASVDGLKKALTYDGSSFQGRNIKVRIADPPKDRGDGGRGDMARELPSWERKGPLADLPSRNNDRRPTPDFGDARRGPRDSPRDAPADDGKNRDFNDWSRKGPLSPLPQQERPSGSRDGSRPRTNDANRTESFRKDRRASPAAWGEGRQDSRPPRREFSDRPERPERPERVPTAAEKDNQWRANMKPDALSKSPNESRDGSEAPPSPAGPASGPAGRPKLNLQKRTVSEATDLLSPALSTTDSKASPFGAARPIDTTAREREIVEKREHALKEKKEAEEKVKEERRLAKEAATKEAAEKAASSNAAEAEAETEPAEKTEAPTEVSEESKAGEASSKDAENGEQRVPVRPKENVQNVKSRANESGNWRSASGGERGSSRGGYQNARGGRGGRGGREGGREGGRDDGPPRGPRFDRDNRPPRANGSPAAAAPAGSQQKQAAAEPASPATPVADADGWTTVPKKGRSQRV